MPTRNIVLTDHQAELIEALVSSGLYQNASEALREGVRLLEKQEAEDKARLDLLRELAGAGMDDIEAGRFRAFEERNALMGYLSAVADDAIARRRPALEE